MVKAHEIKHEIEHVHDSKFHIIDEIHFSLVIKRHPQLLIRNVIGPAFTMGFIMLGIIILPINMIDKIPLVLNILLILTVYQLIITQILPGTK